MNDQTNSDNARSNSTQFLLGEISAKLDSHLSFITRLTERMDGLETRVMKLEIHDGKQTPYFDIIKSAITGLLGAIGVYALIQLGLGV